MKIVIALPVPNDDEHEAQQQWADALRNIKLPSEKTEAEAIQKLGGGVWLILSESGLHFLSTVIAAAEERKVSYRILFVQKEVTWLRSF